MTHVSEHSGTDAADSLPAPKRGFASDNAATVHPAVLEALARVNVGHAFGYGHDPYTAAVEKKVAAAVGDPQASVFFVFNGTGANVLSLRAALRPWQGAIVAETSHLHTDEVGAPEWVAGTKLLVAHAPDAKLDIAHIEAMIERPNEEHFVQPGMISLTQSTEWGTLYGLDEVRAITALAHRHGLLVHMDGSRLANAAAAHGVSLHEVTAGCGIDLLSFGGTKNGLMGGEAVVVFSAEASGRSNTSVGNDALTDGLLHLRKQSLQLASKMRYLAAQFDAIVTDELWLQNASHANAMARRLASAVGDIPGVKLSRQPAVNSVFAAIPDAARAELQEQFDFYMWDEATGEARWMCAWDTTEDDIDTFAAAVRTSVAKHG
jgi:threonine aldolase